MRYFLFMLVILTSFLISQSTKAQESYNFQWFVNPIKDEGFRLVLGVPGTDHVASVSFDCLFKSNSIQFDVDMTGDQKAFLIDLIASDEYPDANLISGSQSERVLILNLIYSEFAGAWVAKVDGPLKTSPIWAESAKNSSLMLVRKDHRIELLPLKEYGPDTVASFAARCANETLTATPQ